jgi:Ca2+-binding EF-hand superfamily protein
MADSLTAEQLREFREAFDILDRNGDGKVTVDDLAAAFRALDRPTSPTEIRQIIGEVDADAKDSIDFPEFLALMSRPLRASEIEEELKVSFNAFANGEEFIGATQLRALLVSLGLDASSAVIRKLLNEGDRDRDGKISFEDFRTLALGE